MDHKDLAALLGVGGLSALSACNFINESSDTDGSTDDSLDESSQNTDADESTKNSLDDGSKEDSNQSQKTEYQNQVEESQNNASVSERPQEESNFNYNEVEEDIEGSDLVSHLTARPSERADGDQIALTPNEPSATELAEEFRVILGVGSDTEEEVSIEGQDVLFVGGTHVDLAMMSGVYNLDDEELVLMARGSSIEAATSVAANWEPMT